jgi:hypothetical protein
MAPASASSSSPAPTASSTSSRRSTFARRRPPRSCGTATRPSAASTPSWCPAGSPTATTCARVPSPGSRRSWRPSSEFAAERWPGRRHLQRLPGAHRGHLLPGALQKNAGPEVPVRTVELRVESTDSVLTSSARSGAVLRVPINHFEGNYTCARRDAGRAARQRSGGAPLRRQPQRVRRRHRRHLQRGAQRRRASCRTRSGRSVRCWAPTTACRSCRR